MSLEISRRYLYRRRVGSFAALAAEIDAQQLFPEHPPGTLAANLIGGYIIGLAVALFASFSGLAPEWRLFVITGFCGGLTTFSTFSSEIVDLLQRGQSLGACGAAALHLAGSVLMTFAGIGTVAWARN